MVDCRGLGACQSCQLLLRVCDVTLLSGYGLSCLPPLPLRPLQLNGFLHLLQPGLSPQSSLPWISPPGVPMPFCGPSVSVVDWIVVLPLCPVRVGCIKSSPIKSQPLRKPVRVAMVLCLLISQASAMNMYPQTEVERQRVSRRDSCCHPSDQAMGSETGTLQVPHRPEAPGSLATLLVEYGKELYRAGKGYGVYAETVNSVAVQRPLIRRPAGIWPLLGWQMNLMLTILPCRCP